MSKTLKQKNNIQRFRITIQGQVQGIGFRPAIYRYAKDATLTGWVANTSTGILLEIEGKKKKY